MTIIAHNIIQSTAPVRVKQTKRIESLDSIRGLAALAVLLGHSIGVLAWPMKLTWISLPVINIFFDGLSAVTMFFVLSGFVLSRPYTSADRQQPTRDLYIPTFFIRRFTRVWIPWFCVFCLSLAAMTGFFRVYPTDPPISEWLMRFWHTPQTASSILKQCVFVLHDAGKLLLPQDWSLGVELKGSALIPVYIYLKRKHILLLIALAIILLITLPTGKYYLAFMFGMLLAHYYNAVEKWMTAHNFGFKCAILAIGVMLYQIHLAVSSSNETSKAVCCICGIGCVLIIVATLGSRRIQAVLNHKAILFLGRVSYSVYLLQFLVLLVVLPRLVHCLNTMGIHNPWQILLLSMTCCVLATLGLSAITYRLIEVPAIKLGQHLTTLVQKR